MKTNLYPHPPHLTVAVYPSGAEEDCFASLCRITEESGCRPRGTVQVAPWDVPFELLSDLAGRSSVMEAGPDRFAALVRADSDHGRAVRAGYVARGISTVVVQYAMAPAGDRHPIGITMGAGPLGTPEAVWSRSDRGLARRLVRFTTGLLRTATEQGRALYGAIDVERSLPTPHELENGTAVLGSEIFVSRDLLDADPRLPQALAMDFPDDEVIDWPHGRCYFGWGMFTSDSSHVSGAGDSRRFARSSAILGRALRAYEAG